MWWICDGAPKARPAADQGVVLDPERRYLIVTDHELDQDRLAAKVQQAMAAGPCRFYLLVLAVPPAGSNNFSDLIGVVGETVPPNTGQIERGWQWASHQLAHELAGLRKLGADADADGESGEPHPLRAISEVLAKRPADEIILATSRHLMARMMAVDLPTGSSATLDSRSPSLGWAGRRRDVGKWDCGSRMGDSNSAHRL